MSKKCCGIIYAKEDQVCSVCGKPLRDEADDLSKEDVDIKVGMLPEMKTESEEKPSEEIKETKVEAEKERPEVEPESKPQEGSEPEEEPATKPQEKAEPEEEPGSGTEGKTEPDTETSYKTDMALLSEIFDTKDDGKKKKKKKKEKKKKKDDTPRTLKAAGILTIVMAVMGFVLVALCGYFMVFAPSYDKKGAADKELIYPYAADEGNSVLREPILGTLTDAQPDESAAEAVVTDGQGGEADD